VAKSRAERTEYERERYRKNPDKERARKRKEYGPSVSDRRVRYKTEGERQVAKKGSKHKYKYNEPYDNKQKRLEEQDFRCANPGCRTTEPGGPWGQWNTDHDHNTGEVRGELCSDCNRALGMLKDDELIIEGLAEYVKKYKSNRIITG